jgi:hypothetical protein
VLEDEQAVGGKPFCRFTCADARKEEVHRHTNQRVAPRNGIRVQLILL